MNHRRHSSTVGSLTSQDAPQVTGVKKIADVAANSTLLLCRRSVFPNCSSTDLSQSTNTDHTIYMLAGDTLEAVVSQNMS